MVVYLVVLMVEKTVVLMDSCWDAILELKLGMWTASRMVPDTVVRLEIEWGEW